MSLIRRLTKTHGIRRVRREVRILSFQHLDRLGESIDVHTAHYHSSLLSPQADPQPAVSTPV